MEWYIYAMLIGSALMGLCVVYYFIFSKNGLLGNLPIIKEMNNMLESPRNINVDNYTGKKWDYIDKDYAYTGAKTINTDDGTQSITLGYGGEDDDFFAVFNSNYNQPQEGVEEWTSSKNLSEVVDWANRRMRVDPDAALKLNEKVFTQREIDNVNERLEKSNKDLKSKMEKMDP